MELAVDADAKARLARIPEPAWRKLCETLYARAEYNERDPRFWARERKREAQKKQEEVDWAHALTASALRGVFGRKPQEIANLYTTQGQQLDDGACLAVADAVRKLPAEDRRRVKE